MGTTVDKLNKLLETKADIKAAIIEKGQTVSDSDIFASYGDKIRAIVSGGSDPVLQSKRVTPTGGEIVVTADEISIRDGYALYNGLEYPVLPEWTKDFTYIWLNKRSSSVTWLIATNDIEYRRDQVNSAIRYLELATDNSYMAVYQNGVFGEKTSHGETSVWHDYAGVGINIVWANFDVCGITNLSDIEGTKYLVLAASDPVTASYAGLSSVTIEGDPDLIPENIAKDVTIYGVTGTHEGGSNGLALPEEYQTYLDEADAFYLGDYEHFFIAENEEYVTVGFLKSGFTVTGYNVATGDFSSYGWYSYKYTKSTDNWEGTDYTVAESPGYNYAKNIKYADCYIKYNDVTLFPVGMNTYPDTTNIDYSNFDDGSFTETLETGAVLEYAVEFNAKEQPNKITAPDGTVTWIEWGES